MSSRIRVRRGTTAEWAASVYVLGLAEPGLDTTLGLLKFGNGVDLWADLTGISGGGGDSELPDGIVMWADDTGPQLILKSVGYGVTDPQGRFDVSTWDEVGDYSETYLSFSAYSDTGSYPFINLDCYVDIDTPAYSYAELRIHVPTTHDPDTKPLRVYSDGLDLFTVDPNGNLTAGGYQQFVEVTAPAAPAANGARLFAKDNGSGKTQLCCRFATGAVAVLATEP